jgi:2-polyprenyl-3-methyl-5-hydroxy-6-metoxy-1,4-benzoquinol methylase
MEDLRNQSARASNSTTPSRVTEVTLDNCDAKSVRAAFERLASLAPPALMDWTLKVARSHVEHYRIVFSHIRSLREKQNLQAALDVGAVPGFISVTLKRSGLEVEAVDIDTSRAQRIFDSAGVPAHQVDIEREALPLASESFDVVLFNEVIEHLRLNPILPLREIHRVLRPGGFIFLSTPNITLPQRIRFVRGIDFQDDLIREFAKLESVGHMGHFRLYSKNEIERLLTHVGFKLESMRAISVGPSRNSRIKRALEKLLPEQFGDHLYVLAQKTSRSSK